MFFNKVRFAYVKKEGNWISAFKKVCFRAAGGAEREGYIATNVQKSLNDVRACSQT